MPMKEDVLLTKDSVAVIYYDSLMGEIGMDAPRHNPTIEQVMSKHPSVPCSIVHLIHPVYVHRQGAVDVRKSAFHGERKISPELYLCEP